MIEQERGGGVGVSERQRDRNGPKNNNVINKNDTICAQKTLRWVDANQRADDNDK